MTTFTLTALALLGVGAARAVAGRSIPRRRHGAVIPPPDPGEPEARPCRVDERLHGRRLRLRAGRRSVCR